MDNFPDHLIIEILSRINDSTELARCKGVSKTLNSLARQVRSICLYCSLDHYTKMRSPETMSKITPFKTIFNKLISDAQVPIEYVSLGIDEALNCLEDCDENYDDDVEDENDDLFLADDDFTGEWLKKIGDGLKSISISDFLVQSYGRESYFFDLISYSCPSLVQLKLKNACVSVNDMHLMPLLTKLTLKYVTIFDESLNKLMESLPCLQVLKLIDVGYTEPKIHHLNLKELKWTLSDCSVSLIIDLSSLTIYTPNLIKLDLECDDPRTLTIHAPLLSRFHLTLERADVFNVEKFKNLKSLRLVSTELYYILFTFPISRTVRNLTLDSPKCESLDESIKFSLLDVCTIFPRLVSLTLGSDVCSKQMVCSPLEPSAHVAKGVRGRNRMKGLKQITLYLVVGDLDKTYSFISYVVGICTNMSQISLLIHRNVDVSVASSFVSSCVSQCSKVRWRWGTWKEGTKDCWISDVVQYGSTQLLKRSVTME